MSRIAAVVIVVVTAIVAWLPAQAGPSTPPPAPPATVRAPAATFEFQYTPTTGGPCTGKSTSGTILDFPESAKADLATAAANWGAVLSSPVPIVVQACWASDLYDPDAVGTGAPTSFVKNPSGAIFADTWYPIALANARAGTDLAPGESDMILTFKSSAGGGVVTMMHELGHGLGFEGNIDVTGGSSAHLAACSPTISLWSPTGHCPAPYDRLATDSSGRLLLSYFLQLWDEGEPPINPSDLYVVGNKLTVDSDAWLGGPNATIQNGGSQVKLYTPPTWTNSSYSHVESLPGNDSLMQSSGGGASGIGPITIGMMRDMGWPLTAGYHQVDISGPNASTPGQSVGLSALYSPSGAANPTSFKWSATDQTDEVRTPGGKTDSKSYSWATAGKKRVIVTANGSTGPEVAGIFEVNVQSPATATPSPTATNTRTPTPGPTATPASRSLLPYVTRH